MSFGIYVHIPYCIQRCTYCDFATYEQGKILPPHEYINRVKTEIRTRSQAIGPRKYDTLYFGGGTPSLLEPQLIMDVVNQLERSGFVRSQDWEFTIEINPATLDQGRIKDLVSFGVNRFSVGAQSFNDVLLKKVGRKHSADDTRATLDLLESLNLNYSFDLLFGLPGQTLDDLSVDLDEVAKYAPPHLSAYCLTVPETNPLFSNRPPDEVQIEMFDLIARRLAETHLPSYEISNFANPGKESRHNMLYWTDQEYWGIGLSAHSYVHQEKWGVRFWNPRSIDKYVQDIDGASTWAPTMQSAENFEVLKSHQALTDFIHTSLRIDRGLCVSEFKSKFGFDPLEKLAPSVAKMKARGLVENTPSGFRLTPKGKTLSNLVFEEFTFLEDPRFK